MHLAAVEAGLAEVGLLVEEVAVAGMWLVVLTALPESRSNLYLKLSQNLGKLMATD
jgi:hypothetical protein